MTYCIENLKRWKMPLRNKGSATLQCPGTPYGHNEVRTISGRPAGKNDYTALHTVCVLKCSVGYLTYMPAATTRALLRGLCRLCCSDRSLGDRIVWTEASLLTRLN